MSQKVKLEDGSIHVFPDDATQDEIQSALGSPPSSPSQDNLSTGQNSLQGFANSPGINAILGAGDALQHNIANVAELIPGVNNVPRAQSGSGTAYNVGDVLGNTAAFMGGGEALGAGRLASEGLPYLGKAAQLAGKVPGVVSRMAGSTGYGALSNPQDRLGGAKTGAEFGLLGEALPYVGKAVGSVFNKFKPQKLSEQIIDYISGGKSLEDNAKSLAEKIKDLYKTKSQEASDIYDPIFKHSGLGGDVIYPEVNPSGIHATKTVPKFDLEGAPKEIQKLNSEFEANPTLQNAHDFQSDLGYAIRKLEDTQKKSGLSTQEDNLLSQYHDARDILKDKISTFISDKDPNLSNEYERATQYYKDNIGPYLNNTRIRQIAKEKKTNPANVHNIFKNPEPGIEKVAADLGEEGQNQIIYSAIGHNKNTVTPERISDAISKLDKQGLESYLNPNLAKQFKSLSSRMRNRDLAQSLFTTIAGSQAGKFLGGTAGQLAGGVIGATRGSDLMKSIQPNLPQSAMGNLLMEYLSKGYSPLSKSVIANMSQGDNSYGT